MRSAVRSTTPLLTLPALLAALSCQGREHSATLTPTTTAQASGVTVRLQAVSAVDDQVVWVSGLNGTFARTMDGGRTWMANTVPGADSLQFRDVYAVDAHTAYLMSAGPGDQSRIYKTEDGGASWTLQYTNSEASGFFDCMDFWDATTGVAFSDAVAGEFPIIRTEDGMHWERLPPDRIPQALPGEGGFAASGTCLVTMGDSLGWIGTGAADTARVLRTTDRGGTWTAHRTPLPAGQSAGITAVAFRDGRHGVVAGGAIDRADEWMDNIAVTEDGGVTWRLAAHPTFPGAVYGAAYAMDRQEAILIAVGPRGASFSADDGMSWSSLDTLSYWGIDFPGIERGWIAGPDGRISLVTLGRLPRQ